MKAKSIKLNASDIEGVRIYKLSSDSFIGNVSIETEQIKLERKFRGKTFDDVFNSASHFLNSLTIEIK